MELSEKLKLSSPWVNYFHEIAALFGEDPDINIVYDEETPEINLYVQNADKADALTKLLPAEKVFGRVVLKLTVIPANEVNSSDSSLFQKAFEGNPVFSYIKNIEGDFFKFPASYVVFKNKVVQYFNDDLSDVNGFRSTLYQDIAKDVFGITNGIYFCTDTEDNIGKPLGEWP